MATIPESNPPSRAPRAVYLLLIGAYLRENRIDEAIAWLHRFLAKSSGEAEAWILLGYLCAEGGLPEMAHACYGCAVKLSPTYVPIVEELNMDLLAPKTTSIACDVNAIDPAVLSDHFATLPEKDRYEISRRASVLVDTLSAAALKRSAPGLGSDVKRLLPVLVKTNLRQALASGRDDLAKELRDLNAMLGGQTHLES